MKKIVFFLVAAAIIVAAAVGVSVSARSNDTYMEFALANLESLARNEDGGDDGTPAEYCYHSVLSPNSGHWHYTCDSQTSPSTIYPCPSSMTEGNGSNRDRCTK